MDDAATYAIPPEQLLKILIIQQRDACISAYREYIEYDMAGAEGNEHKFKAHIRALFIYCRELILRYYERQSKRDKKQEGGAAHNPDYIQLVKRMKSDEMSEVEEAFFTINEVLDAVKLTNIDTRKSYDPYNIEEENAFHSG